DPRGVAIARETPNDLQLLGHPYRPTRQEEFHGAQVSEGIGVGRRDNQEFYIAAIEEVEPVDANRGETRPGLGRPRKHEIVPTRRGERRPRAAIADAWVGPAVEHP